MPFLFLCDLMSWGNLGTLVDVEGSEPFLFWLDRPIESVVPDLFTAEKKVNQMISVTSSCLTGKLLPQFAGMQIYMRHCPQGPRLVESFHPQFLVVFYVWLLYNYCFFFNCKFFWRENKFKKKKTKSTIPSQHLYQLLLLLLFCQLFWLLD